MNLLEEIKEQKCMVVGYVNDLMIIIRRSFIDIFMEIIQKNLNSKNFLYENWYMVNPKNSDKRRYMWKKDEWWSTNQWKAFLEITL